MAVSPNAFGYTVSLFLDDRASIFSTTQRSVFQSSISVLVGVVGLEPTTLRVSDENSNQLSYTPLRVG